MAGSKIAYSLLPIPRCLARGGAPELKKLGFTAFNPTLFLNPLKYRFSIIWSFLRSQDFARKLSAKFRFCQPDSDISWQN